DAAFGLGGVWDPPGRLVHIHRSPRSGGGADQCYWRCQAPSAAEGAASRETSRPTPTCIHWRGRIRTHRNRSRLNSLEAIAAESEDLSALVCRTTHPAVPVSLLRVYGATTGSARGPRSRLDSFRGQNNR